jgi:hypothetical protein
VDLTQVLEPGLSGAAFWIRACPAPTTRVDLTMQNTNTTITVVGDALPPRPVGSVAKLRN